MNFRHITVTAALLLASLALSAGDAAAADPGAFPREGYVFICPVTGEEGDVRVEYLLDSSGRPYLVSVWSSDPAVTQLIRQKLGLAPLPANASGAGAAMGITLYYDSIK